MEPLAVVDKWDCSNSITAPQNRKYGHTHLWYLGTTSQKTWKMSRTQLQSCRQLQRKEGSRQPAINVLFTANPQPAPGQGFMSSEAPAQRGDCQEQWQHCQHSGKLTKAVVTSRFSVEGGYVKPQNKGDTVPAPPGVDLLHNCPWRPSNKDALFYHLLTKIILSFISRWGKRQQYQNLVLVLASSIVL